jgi:hypothetical protein
MDESVAVPEFCDEILTAQVQAFAAEIREL